MPAARRDEIAQSEANAAFRTRAGGAPMRVSAPFGICVAPSSRRLLPDKQM